MPREKAKMPYVFGEPEGLGRNESEEVQEEKERLEGNNPLRKPKGRTRFLPHGVEEVSLSDIGKGKITKENQEALLGDPYNPGAYLDDPENEDPPEEKERQNWKNNEGVGEDKSLDDVPLHDDHYAGHERGEPNHEKTSGDALHGWDAKMHIRTDKSRGKEGKKLGSKVDRTKIIDKVDPRPHGKETDHDDPHILDMLRKIL